MHIPASGRRTGPARNLEMLQISAPSLPTPASFCIEAGMKNKKMIDRSELIEMLADLSGAHERQLSIQQVGDAGDFIFRLEGSVTDSQRKHIEPICEQLRAVHKVPPK